MVNVWTPDGSSGAPIGGGGGGSSDIGVAGGFVNPFGGGGNAAPGNDAGKFSLNMSDPIGSLTQDLKAGGDFVSGIAGAVGSLGIPGGPNLGGVASVPAGIASDALGAAGQALGAVGSVPLPYLGNDPNKTNATLGDVPGAIITGLGLPEKALERTVAGFRVQDAQAGRQDIIGGAFGQGLGSLPGIGPLLQGGQGLPADLQQKLDQGAPVDQIADELVARNAGFTSNPAGNLAAGLALDPMNLIAPGVGKLGDVAKGASVALRTAQEGEKLGVGTRVAGAIYDAATHGLGRAGAADMDKVAAYATRGIFDSLGQKPFTNLRSALGKISPDLAADFETKFGTGAGQYIPAVMADEMGSQVGKAAGRTVEQASADLIPTATEGALTLRADSVRRSIENLSDRVAPTLQGIPDKTAWAVQRLASVFPTLSPEDAAAVVREAGGKNPDLKFLQTVDMLAYGHAGTDVANTVRATQALGKEAYDAVPRLDDLTLVNTDRTLTREAGENLLSAVKGRGAKATAAAEEAVQKYPALGRWAQLRGQEAVSKLREVLPQVMDNLTETLREPKGEPIDQLAEALGPARARQAVRSPLPGPLAELRNRLSPLGYDLGFAPQDSVKYIRTKDGEELFGEPFARFTTDATGPQVKNPISNFAEQFTRGITQQKIINDARNRMVAFAPKVGLTDAEARAFTKAVIARAQELHTTPRGLDITQAAFDDVAKKLFGDSRYAELVRQGFNPTYATMHAFEGNLSHVGLTQKVSGIAKTVGTNLGAPIISGIAEKVYPALKFSSYPLFQLQELIESPFFNIMRGIKPVFTSGAAKAMRDSAQEVFGELQRANPELRLLDGGESILYAWGNKAASQSHGGSELGQALSRLNPLNHLPNIQSIKDGNRIAQIMGEHPAAFKDAIQTVNPKLWPIFEETYGTRDVATIAREFGAERMALARATGPEARAMMERASSVTGKLSSADAETAWQGFLAAFEKSAQQAFETHFFQSNRNVVARSLNHPYLGFYPLSYYTKVVKEFARFLVARPFGLKAPLLGQDAFLHTQQALLAQMQSDPQGFGKWMTDHPESAYMVGLLLPATPDQLPVNLPAWERHAATGTFGGTMNKNKSFPEQAKSEMGDTLTHIGSFNFLTTGPKLIGELGNDTAGLSQQLQDAARQFDGMFGPH